MAKYKGRTVKLNKPFRTPSASKKFGVYVKNNRTARQRSFMARFRPILANVKGQKNLSPAYWAIQSWKKGFKI
jgi:hypothetical protein